jgi:IS30 family transposase
MLPRAKARIRHYLKKGWSPEQIAGRLKRTSSFSISHQSIYSYIQQDRLAGGALYKRLRRKKAYRVRGRRTGPIFGRRSIEERPDVVDARARIGDWEIDTIVSADRRSAMVTVVERVSKYLIIGKLDLNRAMPLAQCVVKLLTPLRNFVHTVTSDNGAEFACHKYISDKLELDFFFAHPYKPHERGLNENTNGLIREYLPKGTTFKNLTQTDAFTIQKRLNRRPRKALEYQTPNEVLWTHVALGR